MDDQRPAEDDSYAEEHRAWLRQLLDQAATKAGVKVTGEVVFGWRDRSVGARVEGVDVSHWLRVVTEQQQWAGGQFWTGNVDAAAIRGVAKPTVVEWWDWQVGPTCVRAELMSLATGSPCSPTPQLRAPLVLPDEWWSTLRTSLRLLAATSTQRVAVGGDEVARRLSVFFGDRVGAPDVRLAAAHADLHWANLLHPRCVLVDWEGWGLAPAGYDAATLYLHTLLVPDTAAQVRAELGEFLDSLDGAIAQLYSTTRLLLRIEGGDYPDLAVPLHRNAEQVIARLAGR